MRRMLVAALAAAAMLAGCAGYGSTLPNVPESPGAVADRTVLDEQGAFAVELAYKASRLAVETAVDAGMITGARASQVAALDRKAYAAVLAVRAAYRTGNAASYSSAIAEGRAAIAQLLALAE